MDFAAQDCDFDQYFCYTFLKSESPTVCIEPGTCSTQSPAAQVQCHQLKSNNGGSQQYHHHHHHQDHQSPIQHFHSPGVSLLQQITPVLPSSPSRNDQQLLFSSSKFSYTLVAQTLPAVKLTEEPVTCLNQGQSYDIKLKKHADTSQAKFYKSNIRLMFHHRRLQHSEQEQFQSWLTTRPDQRLLDLDLPLAYNVLQAKEDPRTPNMTSITWSGQTEASVSVKINCISTEFTAKKHGGEKGVPFRLQVDTYAVLDDQEQNLQLAHRAYCLVKVFKPNGADRKNKNDAIKLSKIPLSERDLYHPVYDVTIFSEVQSQQTSGFSPIEWMAADDSLSRQDTKVQPNTSSRTNSAFSSSQCPSIKPNESPTGCFSPEQNIFQENEKTWSEQCKSENRQAIPQPILTRSSSSLFTDSSPSPPSLRTSISHEGNPYPALGNPPSCSDKVPHLTSDSTSSDLKTWLRFNNFEKLIVAFEHYSGAEIFMLSKDDFMKICGVAEGIRMFYKLYSGLGPSTKKSIYVSYMAGSKRRLYMRKNFSSESLESPSSVSSTVTTGSCSNLLANNISDMTLDHQNQVKATPGHLNSANQVDSNPASNLKKGSKRSREGIEAPPMRGFEDENNNNLDTPHCKKNKFSDERDVELPVYSAVHLKWLTYSHLLDKLSEIFDLSSQVIAQIYLVDRDGTDIAVNDEANHMFLYRRAYTLINNLNNFSAVLEHPGGRDEMNVLAIKFGAVNFAHGFADFDPPSITMEAFEEVAMNPSSILVHQYTRPKGHPRLVNVLARMYCSFLGVHVDPMTNVLVTAGAQHALYCAVTKFLGPDDEMILFEPFFSLYDPLIKDSGVKVEYVRLKLNSELNDKKIMRGDLTFDKAELESKFNKRTKLILLNNPNNPSGKVFSKEELEFIAGLCIKYDVIVLSDEVYYRLVHPPKKHIFFGSLPGMWERTITIGSAGKCFSITGWKLGWCVGPENLINVVQQKHQSTLYNCVTPLQEAVAIAFEKELDNLDDENSYLNTTSKNVLEKLQKLVDMVTPVGMIPIVPDAGYFMLVDISEVEFEMDDSDFTKDVQFSKWMLTNHNISSVPICAFLSEKGRKSEETQIRICFYKSDETLERSRQIFKAWKLGSKDQSTSRK